MASGQRLREGLDGGPLDLLDVHGSDRVAQLFLLDRSARTGNHDRIEWVLLVNLFGGDAEAAAAVRRPLEVQWRQAPSPQTSDNKAGADSWIAHLLPNLMAFSL